jgi:8-oxo-dGTP diphosphatase
MGSPKKKVHKYDYPRPAVTVDVVLLTWESTPKVLLIRRGKDPFAKRWALPGGFVEEEERLEVAAKRELLEETGVTVQDLEQLYAVSDPGRDPRGWTVSIAFLGRVHPGQVQAKAADDAAEVGWFPLTKLPQLAFDHGMILERAATRLLDRKC